MVEVVDKRHTAPGVEEQTDSTDGGAVSAPAMSSPPQVNIVEKQDPATELINKVFAFVVEQPEFYYVLQLTRNERRQLANHIAKVMTTFPHFKKTGILPNAED